jgi:hypothetical protein
LDGIGRIVEFGGTGSRKGAPLGLAQHRLSDWRCAKFCSAKDR